MLVSSLNLKSTLRHSLFIMMCMNHTVWFTVPLSKIMGVLLRTLTWKVIFPSLFFKRNTTGGRGGQDSLQNSHYSVINFEFVSISSRFINLKSELYRFATIGDKILIALALIAASGVGISQVGDHWNICMESLSVISNRTFRRTVRFMTSNDLCMSLQCLSFLVTWPIHL